MLNKKYRFVIVHNVDGLGRKFYYVRIDSRRNGQTIFTSETYTRKTAAVKAVENLVEACCEDVGLVQTVEFEELNSDGTPYEKKKGGKK